MCPITKPKDAALNGVWEVFDFAWGDPSQAADHAMSADEDDGDDGPSAPLALEDGIPDDSSSDGGVPTTQPEPSKDENPDDFKMDSVAEEDLFDSQMFQDKNPTGYPLTDDDGDSEEIPASQFFSPDDGSEKHDPYLVDPAKLEEPKASSPVAPDSATAMPPSPEDPELVARKQRVMSRIMDLRPGLWNPN